MTVNGKQIEKIHYGFDVFTRTRFDSNIISIFCFVVVVVVLIFLNIKF